MKILFVLIKIMEFSEFSMRKNNDNIQLRVFRNTNAVYVFLFIVYNQYAGLNIF